MAESTIPRFDNIISCERVTLAVTTGPTGNIALDYVNDGYTAIIAPHCTGKNIAFRAWVATSSDTTGKWYLTAINPNTGATMNNTFVDVRYWVLKLGRA